MSYDELKQTVKDRLPGRRAISPKYISARYEVSLLDAVKVVLEMQSAGLVSRDWNTFLGGYPVKREVVE